MNDLQRRDSARKPIDRKPGGKSGKISAAIFVVMWSLYIASLVTDWKVAAMMFVAGVLSHIFSDRLKNDG